MSNKEEFNDAYDDDPALRLLVTDECKIGTWIELELVLKQADMVNSASCSASSADSSSSLLYNKFG
jgi:hypothetical protein